MAIEFLDRTAVESGTPVNRATLMAIQGFISQNTVFNEDGSITETNSMGQIKTTTFPTSNTIVETFVGNKTLIKTTTFNDDESITETITEV